MAGLSHGALRFVGLLQQALGLELPAQARVNLEAYRADAVITLAPGRGVTRGSAWSGASARWSQASIFNPAGCHRGD